MNLLQTTFIISALLIVFGLPLLFGHSLTRRFAQFFPRSKMAAGITMFLGTAWFLMRHIANLSDADFGDYKGLITLISVAILVFSFFYLPDFLAVRGASILVLLFAREALDAAFLQEPATRLFMVSVVYLAIVVALYLSAWPYRLRDFFEWLFS